MADRTKDEANVPAIQEPSPTEPNTPTSNGDEQQQQHSSAERHSFSSLINFDPSSQVSNANATISAIQNVPTTAASIEPIAAAGMSRASMLKLRLRVAIYKVQTNQTHLPFKDLKHGGQDVDGKATSEAVEEAVAQLRREAQLEQQRTQPSNNQPAPKLLPAPLLLPTAYSSRTIYEPGLPSSPPAAESPEKVTDSESHEKQAALLEKYTTHSRDARRRSESPESAEGLGAENRSAGRSTEALAGSPVKGRVVEGLLGLRHSA